MPFVKNNQQDPWPLSDDRSVFVGRTGEFLFFLQNILKPEGPTHNILSISGQGGVGKTTLLTHLIFETQRSEFKDYCTAAIIDERQATPVAMMEELADQLHMEGTFRKALKQYKEALYHQQTERETLQDTVLHRVPDFGGATVEGVPIVGPILREGAKVATDHFLNRYRTTQLFKDTERLETPINDLTKAFVAELNRLTNNKITRRSGEVKQRRVILFFDTFEQLAFEASPWLLNHFLASNINNNVVLVIAGRDSIENSTPDDPKRWLPYYDNGTIYSIVLNSFTEVETYAYLTERGITNASHLATIWQLSRGLPLYLGLLTSSPQREVDPTKGVVANFLRWIPEQEQVKRRLALDVALLSKSFNQDDLDTFAYVSQNEKPLLYEWLIKQPFVRQSPQDGRHTYHELAQELFSRYLYQRSKNEYYTTRRALADYYQQLLEEIRSGDGKGVYRSVEWLELALEAAYQLFLLLDETSHIKAVEQILYVCEPLAAQQKEEVTRILRHLSRIHFSNEINPHARRIVEQMLRLFEADLSSRKRVVAASSLIEEVRRDLTFPPEILARIYRTRAILHTYLNEYQQAIEDCNYALQLNPNNAKAYINRGYVYRRLREYRRAIEDFNIALELNPEDTWAYTSRSLAYTQLDELQRAIEDCNHALQLNPNYTWAYICRSIAYRELTEYKLAIKDCNHALNIDPNYTRAYLHRSIAYYAMNEYHKAIEDCNIALALDHKDVWVYVQRGIIYDKLKDYRQAIENFEQAIKLDPYDSWAYIQRGITYRILKQYEMALADFNHAITLDPNHAWIYGQRGVTYQRIQDYSHALNDFNYALEIRPEYCRAYKWRGFTYLWLRDIKHAENDFAHIFVLQSKDINAQWMAEWSRMCQKRANAELARQLEVIAQNNSGISLSEYIYHVCYGVAAWLHSNFEQALAELEKALKMKSDWWDAHFWKGMSSASLDQDEKAIISIEKALEEGMPPILLTPLCWFEQDRPDFYQKHVLPLLKVHCLQVFET